MDFKTAAVIAEHEAGRITPVSLELLTLANELAEREGLEPLVVVLGDDPEGPAREIAEFSGLRTLAVRNPGLSQYNNEIYKEILTGILAPLQPGFVLTPNSTKGLDFVPGLAVRLGGTSLTNVNGAEKRGDAWVFSRGMFGGKLSAAIAPLIGPSVMTVQGGAFRPGEPASSPGVCELIESDIISERVRTLGVGAAREGSSDITAAEVIVAAGRGVGKKENMDLIHRTAALFSRSAAAGSRPVCDNGWLDYPRQVGMTGAVVTPKLYLACGISGASQHISGMQGSGFIVSISTDPGAAIFNVSDVCVVEDLTVFLPALIELVERENGGEAGD